MLRMIDRHAVQQMLTAGVRIGEVARYFEPIAPAGGAH